MDSGTVIVAVSIAAAGITMALGGYGPARAEGEAVAKAMEAIARQPESAGQIMRTLFVGLAFIEAIAIYALVIAMVILFANPLLEHVTK
ncbi:MAG TPA: F0F1 ATP synthase subunit C [Nitrospirota bacterium]